MNLSRFVWFVISSVSFQTTVSSGQNCPDMKLFRSKKIVGTLSYPVEMQIQGSHCRHEGRRRLPFIQPSIQVHPAYRLWPLIDKYSSGWGMSGKTTHLQKTWPLTDTSLLCIPLPYVYEPAGLVWPCRAWKTGIQGCCHGWSARAFVMGTAADEAARQFQSSHCLKRWDYC